MASSSDSMDVCFIDFSNAKQTRLDVEEKLSLLLQILKDRFNPDTKEGFWGNRELIKENHEDLVIAVERKTSIMVGFCLARVDDGSRAITGYILQSFIERRGVATALLNYVTTRSPGYSILIEEPLEGSRPFWEIYFKRNPRASYATWLVVLPHSDGGPGPHFSLKAPLSKAEFVVILSELDAEYEDKDGRTFEPLRYSEGGIKVCLPTAPGNDPHLELRFANYGFPHVSTSWEEEWKTDRRPVLSTGSFKSRIGYSITATSLQWRAEDIHTLQRVFQRHNVKVDFFIHTK